MAEAELEPGPSDEENWRNRSGGLRGGHLALSAGKPATCACRSFARDGGGATPAQMV